MKNGPVVNIENFFYSPNGNYIFEETSFTIPSPGFHSIIGKSGTGKSTLAKIISNLISLDKYTKFNTFFKNILYCYDEEKFPQWQNIRKHIYSLPIKEGALRIKYLLNDFNLSDEILEKYPYQLSSGESNRLNLIRYLILPYDVLILDEVLSSVDEPTRLDILLKIKQNLNDPKNKSSDKTIIYITHNLAEVALFSKNITLLKGPPNRGRLEIVPGKDKYQLPSEDKDLSSLYYELKNKL